MSWSRQVDRAEHWQRMTEPQAYKDPVFKRRTKFSLARTQVWSERDHAGAIGYSCRERTIFQLVKLSLAEGRLDVVSEDILCSHTANTSLHARCAAPPMRLQHRGHADRRGFGAQHQRPQRYRLPVIIGRKRAFGRGPAAFGTQ